MKHIILITTMLVLLALSMCVSVSIITASKPAEEPKVAPALNVEGVYQIHRDMKTIRKLVGEIIGDLRNAGKSN